jgi:hypothetical protein
MVREDMGNQSANQQKQQMILCVATEDFEIPDTYTDVYGVVDKVPSGTCLRMCLDMSDADYKEETAHMDFRVYDPVSKLMDIPTKSDGDVFYAIYNTDSRRWEVFSVEGQGRVGLRHALVCRCIGKGWYVLELMDELQLTPPEEFPFCEESLSDSFSDSLSDSLSDSGSSGSEENIGCDLCDLPTNDGDLACPAINYYEECGLPDAFDPLRPRREESCEQVLTGNGIYVFAYDKRAVPLKENGQVTIAWLGDTIDLSLSDSGSASASVSGSSGSESVNNQEKIWIVLNGEYEMVSIPHEDWECCDDVIKRVSCVTFLVEGVMCTGPEDPCDSASV